MTVVRRRAYGGAISETGPSLLILFVFIFFPLIDCLYIGAGFGMAWYLHREEIRELSVHRPADWQVALNKADHEFIDGAIGQSLKIERDPIADNPPVFSPNATNPEDVRLVTKLKIKPLFYFPSIPGLGNVPGLSAPIPVSFESIRAQEEKGRD